MNIVLVDSEAVRAPLMPLTFTRPAAEIRCGLLTLAEKWRRLAGPDARVSHLTYDYLSELYPLNKAQDNLLIDGSVLADEALFKAITQLEGGRSLHYQGRAVALRCKGGAHLERVAKSKTFDLCGDAQTEYGGVVKTLQRPWDIITHNGEQIRFDFERITAGRTSQALNDPHTKTYAHKNIFIEEGAQIRAAILNAEDGPIYIGKNARVHEGAIIKGPFALCESSHVNPGAKMRGDSTIGPFSKVGGEVACSVLFGYSNKGHEGFLGHSVLGEWCNLGADTNTSNLKNTYSEVRCFSYHEFDYIFTGKQFSGLIMGDHGKAGINAMFNTGTIAGVGVNIFGSGFPPKFIPSFVFGDASHAFKVYDFDKLMEVEGRMMERRGKMITEEYRAMMRKLFRFTDKYRAGFVRT